MSKFHELAKKLQALAVGGVGGERENAAAMLGKLCRKHGIDLDALFQPAPKERKFAFESEEHMRFLFQCVASVSADVKAVCSTGPLGSFLLATLSDAEFVEAESKAAFFWPIWLREKESFYTAFVQKHRLGKAGVYRDASAEERAELRRKMESMDAHTRNPQLSR